MVNLYIIVRVFISGGEHFERLAENLQIEE